LVAAVARRCRNEAKIGELYYLIFIRLASLNPEKSYTLVVWSGDAFRSLQKGQVR
jgi:hypothetical protein